MSAMLEDHGDPRGVSARALAKLIGVSHTAINLAVADGHLTRNAHGRFFPATAMREWRDSRRTPGIPAATPAGHDAPAAPASPTISRLQQVELALRIEERKVRLDVTKGKLIDRAKARDIVMRLARAERDAILSWPARAAPVMAAELGIDQHRLETLLDSHLRDHLSSRSLDEPTL